MAQLEAKVAIVTGGAASIGLAISRKLLAEGAFVAIAARSATSASQAVSALGERVALIRTDIRQDDDLSRLIEQTMARFGRLDILVNNACSYGDDGCSTDRSTWLDTLNTNVVSAALLGELARPHLARTQGNIVNVGSISGLFPHVGRWAYPVSKAALRHLSKSQALDYAADGIRVNLITVGHTWSDPFSGLTGDDRRHANDVAGRFNLIGRTADAEEVAGVVAFVASAAASFMTGGEVPVDGGYSVLGPEQRVPLMPLLKGKD